MTHTYQVTGMTCSGCVANIKSSLLKLPGVLSAEVSLEKQEAVITMEKHIPLETLQAAAGKYTITEKEETKMPEATAGVSFLNTYKPLLLVFAFTALVALLTSFRESAFDGMIFMNHFMAGFFITFSFFKLLDLSGFASAFSMYDIVAKRFYAYGYVYPFIELALGLAYLTGYSPVFTNAANLVVMGIGTAGVVQSVMNKRKIRCACLGAVFNLPMSTVTIIENSIMIAMAVVMLVVY